MLAAAALFLHARSHPERLPPHQELASFPHQLAGWTGRDLGIDPSVREVLGAGDFLSRIYVRPGQPYIELFIAFFPSQRTGTSIHSPKNCLPGSGWSPLASGEIRLPTPVGDPVPVNRYVIGRGLDRQLVLYWYQAHNRSVASEYWAKFYLVADAIRMNRTDGALVRIVTPVADGESLDQAQQQATDFAQHLRPLLDAYIPR